MSALSLTVTGLRRDQFLEQLIEEGDQLLKQLIEEAETEYRSYL